jgi:hypothetical protein
VGINVRYLLCLLTALFSLHLVFDLFGRCGYGPVLG